MTNDEAASGDTVSVEKTRSDETRNVASGSATFSNTSSERVTSEDVLATPISDEQYDDASNASPDDSTLR